MARAYSAVSESSLETPLISLYFASNEPDFYIFLVVLSDSLEGLSKFPIFSPLPVPDQFQRNLFCLLRHLKLTYESFNHEKKPLT